MRLRGRYKSRKLRRKSGLSIKVQKTSEINMLAGGGRGTVIQHSPGRRPYSRELKGSAAFRCNAAALSTFRARRF